MSIYDITDAWSSFDQSLERYLIEIGAEPLLEPGEEIALAAKIKSGDQKALERLTRSNLRFVVSVAKQYQNQGLALGDLINEGNLGLIKAARRFDETRGFKFISYAVWWIRQSILQALAEQSRIVRLPLNRVGALHRISKAFSLLEQDYKREPLTAEIAEELEMTAVEIFDTMQITSKRISLDAAIDDDEESRWLDILEDSEQLPPDTLLMDESLQKDVDAVLRTLSKREAEVVRLYFGLGMEHALTLEEIGERFSLTRERVRQIKEKALRRLRHTSRSQTLRSYLG